MAGFAMYDASLNGYLDELLPERPPVVREMELYAEEKGFPFIGPQVGRVLTTLAMMSRAKRVFEMGSGYGYSAYWFLQGMSPEGRVIMTDGSDANRKLAMFHHDRLGTKDRVEFHVGNAVDILRETDGPFDIIFNDIDKEQYPDAYHAAVHKLHPGGLFITDNTLWSGRVADKSNKDEATEGVREFNRLLFADWDLFPVILPIRDGLAVAVKKG